MLRRHGENGVTEVYVVYPTVTLNSFCNTCMVRLFCLSPAAINAKFLHVPVTVRIQELCGSLVKEQITGKYDRAGMYQWQLLWKFTAISSNLYSLPL